MQSDLIERVDLDLTVVGLRQHEYTANGVRGDIAAAVRVAELMHIDALEVALQATVRAIRERNVELDELGEALAVLAGAQTYYSNHDDDWKYAGADFKKVIAVGGKYGITVEEFEGYDKNQVSVIMERFQEKMDSVNNSLNQAMQAVDSYYMKRDQGFTRIGALQGKVLESAGRAIRSIGG